MQLIQAHSLIISFKIEDYKSIISRNHFISQSVSKKYCSLIIENIRDFFINLEITNAKTRSSFNLY